jgi:hypothetical protein
MSIGRSTYALQFMLDTSLSDALRHPLRLGDLVVADVDPDVAYEKYIPSSSRGERIGDVACVGLKGDSFYRHQATFGEVLPYTGTVMTIDPSGRGADETAYAVVKMLNGYLHVPAEGVGGMTGGYGSATLEKLALIAKKNKVNTIVIESNFGDAMFTALLKPYLAKHHPCEVLEERASIQKELRIIDTLEPVLNQHRLIIDRSLIDFDSRVDDLVPSEKRLFYQLFYQLTRITKDKNSLRHDDRLDALAAAVKYWVEQMAQDADTNICDRRDKDREALLRSFETGSSAVINTMMGATTDQIESMRGGLTSSMFSCRSSASGSRTRR